MKQIVPICLFLSLVACSVMTIIIRRILTIRHCCPDPNDYLDNDYGTQALANEIAGVYSSNIGLVFYDVENPYQTRIIPYTRTGQY